MQEATTTSEMIVFLVILAVRAFCSAAWDCCASGAMLVKTAIEGLAVVGFAGVVVAMLRVGAGAVVTSACWLVVGAAEVGAALLLVGTEEVEGTADVDGVEDVEESVVDVWDPPNMPVRLSRRPLRVEDTALEVSAAELTTDDEAALEVAA